MNLHIPVNTSYQQTISSLIQADLSDMFKTDSKSGSTMTIVLSPDPLSPTKSTSSATIMPDQRSPGPTQHW